MRKVCNETDLPLSHPGRFIPGGVWVDACLRVWGGCSKFKDIMTAATINVGAGEASLAEESEIS